MASLAECLQRKEADPLIRPFLSGKEDAPGLCVGYREWVAWNGGLVG